MAGVYAVVGWLLAQVAATLEGAVGLPAWFDGLIVCLLLLGFPVALILAWAFEMTPAGVKLTKAVAEDESIAARTGRKLDYAILAGFGLVVVLVVADRLTRAPSTQATTRTAVAAEEQAIDRSKSIAVLPFDDFSAESNQEWFADGLTEELLNALSRAPDIRLASRSSSFGFKGSDRAPADSDVVHSSISLVKQRRRRSGGRIPGIAGTGSALRVDKGTAC